MKESEAGFTLAELLIASTMMLLVTCAVLAILDPVRTTFEPQSEAADLQQRLRVAADALASGLWAAGGGRSAGGSPGPLARYLPSVFPARIGLTSPDPPGTFRRDVVSVVSSAGTAQTTIEAAVDSHSSTLSIALDPGCSVADGSCGFVPGMLALLYDPSGAWDLVSVAAVDGRVVTRRGGVALSKRYDAGASLVAAEVASFATRVEPGDGVAHLRRYDGDRSELPLVDHVVFMAFEYLGEPRPPVLDPGVFDERGPLTTYGPRPPPLGSVEAGSGYAAGENCLFRVDSGVQVPRLPHLGTEGGLVRLDAAALTDGPWCPGPAAANRFDADLLRVRQVRVVVRVEAAASSARGGDPRLFFNPGVSTDVRRWVPDQEIRFDVTPRNLNLAR